MEGKGGELLKIVPSPFLLILRVNRNEGKGGGNEGEMFPSVPFIPPHLIFPNKEISVH